ncbi:pilus assembly protein [Gilvimarinus sp. F26214L]|uniref:pilus assembly protein n=1 Tax=Gilvimarinus sp. DZF01 TaxID=3461371 RepID=UPI004045564C
MSQSASINLSSLGLVHDELVATIEQSAGKLEQFVADMDSSELLQSCIEGLQQITGTLSLVQLKGADLLAQEALALATEITVGDEKLERRLGALTDAFFVIPRYIEYTLQTRRALPVLLIPTINDLRQARGAALLEESYFFPLDLQRARPLPGQTSAALGEDLTALVRRLRHMYQAGLVNVLQGRLVKPSLGMMQRAMQRLAAVSGDRPMGTLWRVAATALEVMATEQMEINRGRKLLFGAIDRQIKALQTKGRAALDQDVPATLIKDCVYLVSISGASTKSATEILEAFPHDPPGILDRELSRQGEVLLGPSATTVHSVAAVMREELNKIKDVLERASQSGVDAISDFDELLGMMGKVAEILSVVGLISPSNALKEEMAKVEAWRDSPGEADPQTMIDVADVVLYIESTISSLEISNLSDEKLAQANSIARQEVIASSQLAEAELIVLQEAESGLALVKRALNAFAESNYDRGHIKNVAATLTSVRGGMAVLSLARASQVVSACVEFVSDTLLHNDQPAALQHLLETFADAVIGLEYYLDAVKSDRNAGDSILEIAEESLAALGHAVKP